MDLGVLLDIDSKDESSDESCEGPLSNIDNNITVITSDDHCKEVFNRLKKMNSLNEDELKLVDLCLDILNAEPEKDFNFGMEQIFALGQLAMSYNSMADDILGCCEYLVDIIEADFPFEDFDMENLFEGFEKILVNPVV